MKLSSSNSTILVVAAGDESWYTNLTSSDGSGIQFDPVLLLDDDQQPGRDQGGQYSEEKKRIEKQTLAGNL